jgi:hypothetical protein
MAQPVQHERKGCVEAQLSRTLASQDAQLHAAGAAKVYAEKASGAKTDRPELAKVIRRLAPGDTLMVTRLDRLARSTRDLLNIPRRHRQGPRGLQVARRSMGGLASTPSARRSAGARWHEGTLSAVPRRCDPPNQHFCDNRHSNIVPAPRR